MERAWGLSWREMEERTDCGVGSGLKKNTVFRKRPKSQLSLDGPGIETTLEILCTVKVKPMGKTRLEGSYLLLVPCGWHPVDDELQVLP